jgi:hypothetical protein
MDLNDAIISMIELLHDVKKHLEPSKPSIWANRDPDELIEEIDLIEPELKEKKFWRLLEIKINFLPTSCYQEIAMHNGWGDEFIELGERFDRIYAHFPPPTPGKSSNT